MSNQNTGPATGINFALAVGESGCQPGSALTSMAGAFDLEGVTWIPRNGVPYTDYHGAARYLGSSYSTIANKVSLGRLKPRQFGRRKLLDKPQLDREGGFSELARQGGVS